MQTRAATHDLHVLVKDSVKKMGRDLALRAIHEVFFGKHVIAFMKERFDLSSPEKTKALVECLGFISAFDSSTNFVYSEQLLGKLIGKGETADYIRRVAETCLRDPAGGANMLARLPNPENLLDLLGKDILKFVEKNKTVIPETVPPGTLRGPSVSLDDDLPMDSRRFDPIDE